MKEGSRFSISYWYGGIGNNIQQISNSIYYCEINKLNFSSPPHNFIEPFSINFGKENNVSSRFYFYSGKERDFDCDIQDLNNNRQRIIQQYIVPNLKRELIPEVNKESLVIHIRSGDVFCDSPHPNYVQNPLSFFTKIIRKYKDVIVVTSDSKNPVVDKILQNDNIRLQTNSVAQDFLTLMEAKNLVTSGVGTFSIAAALCSSKLENFYCSNLFLPEHLNYTMLKTVVPKVTKIENYIKIGHWKNTKEQRKMMEDFIC